MTIKEQILNLFRSSPEITVKEVVDRTGASKQMVHIAMKQLLDEGLVLKLGRTPKTVYRINTSPSKTKELSPSYSVTKNELDFLQKHFIVVTEIGNLLEGMDAFVHWCEQRKLPVKKTLDEYRITKKKLDGLYDNKGNVNGSAKLQNTKEFKEIHLNQLFYLDFYAIERFGKTRLGTILHYAKQGQNKFLMKMLVEDIHDRIMQFVTQHKADAICFIPPTIRREVQLMKYLQTHIRIPLPVVDVKKMSGLIPVPQKSLNKMDERIRNAENTFAVTETGKFKHIILIDDAVGSGATLNQIAGKIKSKKIASKVTGLAVVGSLKGFDVVTDV